MYRRPGLQLCRPVLLRWWVLGWLSWSFRGCSSRWLGWNLTLSGLFESPGLALARIPLSVPYHNHTNNDLFYFFSCSHKLRISCRRLCDLGFAHLHWGRLPVLWRLGRHLLRVRCLLGGHFLLWLLINIRAKASLVPIMVSHRHMYFNTHFL